jgi:hypothetical protein
MALLKTVSTVHGFEAVDAYHRVEAVSIVGKESVNFYLRSYKEVDKPFFAEQLLSANYSLTGENPIKQAYLHVKSLSQFSDAVDC